MAITTAHGSAEGARSRSSLRSRLQDWLPRLVLAPSFLLVLTFVYGFNAWTVFLSFTNSKGFTSTKLVGWANYQKLWTWSFETDPPSGWYTALVNMGLFGSLYVIFCLILGLTLAILLDQKIRGEGVLRPIYLYPLALSFIVTGTAWKLLLDPRIGLEKAMHDWGWTSFHFDWVVNPRMMIYCVAIAGVWQTSGFVMAMFLAGLRGIDGEILKAAQIDGASAFATYRRIVIPIMRPVFLSAIIVLAHMAIKSYDLVL
jgi:glucose/mannose transport system permease protein